MTTRTRTEDPFVNPDSYVLEDEEGNPVETSQPTHALQPFQADDWDAKLAKVKMLGTYKRTVEVEYGTHKIIGFVYRMVERTGDVESVDEDTGEVVKTPKVLGHYRQLCLKTHEGKVMMASGKGADRFFKEDLDPLGLPALMGDFPAGKFLTVKVQPETLKTQTKEGQPKKWPVFTLV